MKSSFILFQSYKEYFEDLTGDETKELLMAIFDYESTRVKPTNLSTKVSCYFLVIKQHLDKNYEEYLKMAETNRQNGKKGGRPKTQPNPKNPVGYLKTQPNPKNLDNDNDIVNDNDIDNNKKEKIYKKENTSQTKQLSASAEIVKPLNSQQRVYEYFASKYLKLTGIKYLSKRSDFISLSDLIHKYGEDMVKQKIDWLEIGCVNRVFWFAKDSGVNSFSVGKLKSQWNEILPQLTDEQRRRQEEQVKEEQRMKEVLNEVQKLKEERNGVSNRRTKAISID